MGVWLNWPLYAGPADHSIYQARRWQRLVSSRPAPPRLALAFDFMQTKRVEKSRAAFNVQQPVWNGPWNETETKKKEERKRKKNLHWKAGRDGGKANLTALFFANE